MKKNLFTLFALFTALCFFTSCNFSTPEEDKGTKLVVSNWADNVYSVALESQNGQGVAAVHKAESCSAYQFFNGQVKLRVSYTSLTQAEKEQFLGYGILSGSAKPFKVFVEGKEVENQHPVATTQGENNTQLSLNANVDYFEYTFNITSDVKTVNVKFENAPEKISHMQLRLADQTNYAYFDLSDLRENFPQVVISKDSNLNEHPSRINYGLNFFKKVSTSRTYILMVGVNDGLTLPSNLTVEGNATLSEATSLNQNLNPNSTQKYFSIDLDLAKLSDGEIIKITRP